jgi:hypothetical protein
MMGVLHDAEPDIHMLSLSCVQAYGEFRPTDQQYFFLIDVPF